jgi:hypothetical protein
VAQGWRLEFEWLELSREQKRQLLTLVGDCGGEWWGRGRAEFSGRADALRCLKSVSSDRGIRGRLLYWLS